MNNNFNTFNSKEELRKTLSSVVAKILQDTIIKDGFALIALSGGSTPKPFFEVLSNEDISWDKVIVSLVDERWVEPTSNDSNEKLVREYLLINKAKVATFIPLKNSYKTPQEGEHECNENLLKLKKDFDVVILGMGEDGHTASFFPTDKNLEKAFTTKDKSLATRATNSPHERITLSLDTLLKAKHIFLHIEGEKKKEVYEKAIKIGDKAMPVNSILNNPKQVEVYYGE